jgi:glycerophosphoryl diester phosphodiesterase
MTLVVAHRGAPVQAPENTMESFRLGAAAGADAIELDVHLTSDGHLAVIHDETVDRTTDGTGEVASFTLEDLRKLDAGARFTAADGSMAFAGKGVTIPTLEEVLDWLPDDVGLVVEIKARAAAPKVVEALRERAVSRDGRAIVISFDEAAIEEVHALDPQLPTGYLLVPTQPFEPALRWAVEHSHAAVHTWEGDLGLDPAPALSQAAAYGRQIGCYVVNDPDRMKQLAVFGLWGFVTDVPDVARAALGPREAR